MNLTLFLLCLFGLQAICLIVGKLSSKGLQNQEDYFLAGKGIRFFPLMMTFLATQVGGGLVLGSAEEAYHYGWSVLFYPLGAALGLIVLGLGTGRRLAQMGVSTIAQIFEKVYGSVRLKQLASVLSIVSLFMIFIAQIIASQKFMLSLGVDNPIWFFGFWGIVIVYTAMGGLKAVVATDIVQAAFFIGVFLFSFIYVFFSGTPDHIVSQTPEFAFDLTKLSGWLLMPLLFMLIEQDMGQRCFAADSPQAVTKATLWAGVGTFLICVVPVFFGVYARSLDIQIPPGASVLMVVMQATTTPVIAAIVGCAILVAIISTADSLINAIGSNLGQDFEWVFLKNIRVSQALTAIIAIAGIFFSLYFDSIVGLLVQSYELSVSCLFVPIVFAIFRKQGNLLSASLAIACGAIGFILFRFLPFPLPREISSLILSLGGFYLGELLVSFLSNPAVHILSEERCVNDSGNELG